MNAMTAILEMPNDLPFAPKVEAPVTYKPVAEQEDTHDMRGQLLNREAIVRFIEAGNATFTIVSKKSGTRFTYNLSRPKANGNAPRPIWVGVLNGQDNNSDFAFAGTVWLAAHGYSFRQSAKAVVKPSAPSLQLFLWLVTALNQGRDESITKQAEFWHEGKCGRCGRKLTVPASINSGFGPECITKI